MLPVMAALRLARRQIIAYGILALLFDLVIWLPGDPFYATTQSFFVNVAFQGIIVWRLWHRSRTAWVLAFLVALLTIPLIGLAMRVEAGEAALIVVSIAQVLVLTASSIWAYVWSSGRVTAASS
jgi:hypothetical protein